MPRIFDNIELPLLKTLKETLQSAVKADFCVGYFNLRGWGQIDRDIEQLPESCRLIVGMQRPPEEELRRSLSIGSVVKRMDRQESIRLKKLMAQTFREQLTIETPTNADEQGLQRLKHQLMSGKLTVKLFLRHGLHAKLYLVHTSRRSSASPTLPLLSHRKTSHRRASSRTQSVCKRDRRRSFYCLRSAQQQNRGDRPTGLRYKASTVNLRECPYPKLAQPGRTAHSIRCSDRLV